MATDRNPVAPTSEHAAFLGRVHEAVDAAAASADHPSHELQRIDRVVSQRLHPSQSDRMARDVAAVGAAAQIDLVVPTESRIAVGRGVKSGIKRLVSWYVDPLGHQVSVLGGATASFAAATSKEVDRLEGEIAELRAQVAELTSALVDDGEDETVS